jgi:hypothetical protein
MNAQVAAIGPLERDDFCSDRYPALSFCLNMIFSENRRPLFRIMHLEPFSFRLNRNEGSSFLF